MDEYLDGLAPEQRAALARVREIVAGLVPDAKEGKSYGMPAFIYAGLSGLERRAISILSCFSTTFATTGRRTIWPAFPGIRIAASRRSPMSFQAP